MSQVPEKPALEGLETRWMQAWETLGTYRFDRTAAARARLRHRHAAADRQRIAARRPRVLLHAHRRHRALPADARPRRVLSDGVGRQRPADRAARAELLRRAVRSVAAVRPGVRAAGRSRPSRPSSISRPNFVELCERLTAEDEKAFEASVAATRPVGRLEADLRDDRQAARARLAARVPAECSRAARPISSRRRRCGTSTSARPWRRPSSKIARCPAPITASASPNAPGAAPVEIDTTRPELIPACVALVAHPDDARYQPLFGTGGADAAVRRAGAGARACAGRSRKGHRHRDDLHVRRPDRRHLVARAVAAGARDHPGERHAAAGHVGRRRLGIARTRRARSATTTRSRASRRSRRARGSSRCCASPAI